MFAYRETEGARRPVFLIFNYRGGVWYPFLPILSQVTRGPLSPMPAVCFASNAIELEN